MKKETCLIRTFVKLDDKSKQKEGERKRGRIMGLRASELVTIFCVYKKWGYKTLRECYNRESEWLRQYFPKLPNYKGLMKLRGRANRLLADLLEDKTAVIQKQSRRFYIDATPLPVCKLVRSRQHVTTRSLATYGYSSTGAFYGLKLHAVIDETKNLGAFAVSPGNVHDVNYLTSLTIGMSGKIAADRGYLSASRKANLEKRGLNLITKHRKNMPSPKLSPEDNTFLRKRPKIETFFRQFKHLLANGLSFARSISGAFSEILISLAVLSLDFIQ